MRVHAKDLSASDLWLWNVKVDGISQPFVTWFDTKEKVAECDMVDKDGRFIMIDGDIATFTIHRFDVYYGSELVERVQ